MLWQSALCHTKVGRAKASKPVFAWRDLVALLVASAVPWVMVCAHTRCSRWCRSTAHMSIRRYSWQPRSSGDCIAGHSPPAPHCRHAPGFLVLHCKSLGSVLMACLIRREVALTRLRDTGAPDWQPTSQRIVLSEVSLAPCADSEHFVDHNIFVSDSNSSLTWVAKR